MISLPLHIFYPISTIVPGCHISFSVYPTQRYLKFSLCYRHSCLLCCMLNFEIIYYKNDEHHQSSPCWQVSFSHRKNLTYFITFNYHSSLRIINYNIKWGALLSPNFHDNRSHMVVLRANFPWLNGFRSWISLLINSPNFWQKFNKPTINQISGSLLTGKMREISGFLPSLTKQLGFSRLKTTTSSPATLDNNFLSLRKASIHEFHQSQKAIEKSPDPL